MSDPRVYVDQELAAGSVITLDPAAQHHLVVVLRRARGDDITLFNGRGGEYAARIDTVGKRELRVQVREFRDVARESPLAVTLGQAVSKGERMDYAIQKAVELGVVAIQPLVTDRVVVRLDDARWQRKHEHWRSVAVAACEQSGRTRVPDVAPVLDLHAWLPTLPAAGLRFVLGLGAPAGVPRPPFRGQPVTLLVGPEGGLSEADVQLSQHAGFLPLALGPRTLRTETAGVVALSVMQSLWGDLAPGLDPKGK